MRYKTLDEQTRDVYYDEGKKDGIEEGYQKGKKDGIEETQINTFNKLLKEGWTIEAAREFVYETGV